jgi:hypothetical protein
MIFSSSLALTEEGCVAYTHGEHEGEEMPLLAQLRLPLATSSKRIPPDKSLLLIAKRDVSHALALPLIPAARCCFRSPNMANQQDLELLQQESRC